METRAAARQILALLASFLLLLLGSRVAGRMLDADDATTLTRAVAVVIAVGAQLPWLLLAGWLTVRSDEYARAGLYQSMGIGLGISILVLCAIDQLQLAGFLGWSTMPASWQIVILCWAAGIVIVRVLRR